MARRSLEPIPNKTLTEDKTFVYSAEETKVEEPTPKKTTKAKPKTGTVINCSKLAFRDGPSVTNQIIRPLDVGTKVDILGEENEFYKIQVDGTEGYAMSSYIKKG